MKRKILFTIIILLGLISFPHQAEAYLVNLFDFEGNEAQAVVEVIGDSTNSITFNLSLVNTTADFRGFYFNFDDSVALSNFNITGADVTGWDISGDVSNLGGGVNMNGTGESFDVGLLLGTPGIGSDDIGTTSFTIYNDTAIDLGSLFGARLTSVGDDREGSRKMLGEHQSSTPEPATLFLFGAGLAGIAFRKRNCR